MLGSSAELGQRRLSEFYANSGAVVVSSSNVGMARLVDMYFAARPPFESSGKKKTEFPDAIALLTIEEWARERDGKVLIVSNDSGWRNFCAASERLFMADGLGEALAHFQPHNLAATLIRQLQAKIVENAGGDFSERITAEIARFVERQTPEAEATSSYALDEQYVSAEHLSHEFYRGTDRQPEINLVRVSTDRVVLQLYASVSCEITAEYRLSLYDSIDREYLQLQKRKVSTTTTFDADIVIEMVGDFHHGLSDVQVQAKGRAYARPFLIFVSRAKARRSRRSSTSTSSSPSTSSSAQPSYGSSPQPERGLRPSSPSTRPSLQPSPSSRPSRQRSSPQLSSSAKPS
jgi:hypothetical protein